MRGRGKVAFAGIGAVSILAVLAAAIVVFDVVRTGRVKAVESADAQSRYDIVHEIGENTRENQRNFAAMGEAYHLPAGLVALNVQDLMKAEAETPGDVVLHKKIDDELQWWLQQ